MLLLIFAVLILLLVETWLPAHLLTQQVGTDLQVGPRDDLPEPTPELGRARRAVANFQETLPIFLTFAILSIVFLEQGSLSVGGAALYLLARIAHLYCYLRGLSPWRSIAYLASVIGMLVMAVPLVPHIWG